MAAPGDKPKPPADDVDAAGLFDDVPTKSQHIAENRNPRKRLAFLRGLAPNLRCLYMTRNEMATHIKQGVLPPVMKSDKMWKGLLPRWSRHVIILPEPGLVAPEGKATRREVFFSYFWRSRTAMPYFPRWATSEQREAVVGHMATTLGVPLTVITKEKRFQEYAAKFGTAAALVDGDTDALEPSVDDDFVCPEFDDALIAEFANVDSVAASLYPEDNMTVYLYDEVSKSDFDRMPTLNPVLKLVPPTQQPCVSRSHLGGTATPFNAADSDAGVGPALFPDPNPALATLTGPGGAAATLTGMATAPLQSGIPSLQQFAEFFGQRSSSSAQPRFGSGGIGEMPVSKTSLPAYAEGHFFGPAAPPAALTDVPAPSFGDARPSAATSSAPYGPAPGLGGTDPFMRLYSGDVGNFSTRDFLHAVAEVGEFTVMPHPIMDKVLTNPTLSLQPHAVNDMIATFAKDAGLPTEYYLVSKLTAAGGVYVNGLDGIAFPSAPQILASHMGSPQLTQLEKDSFPVLVSTSANMNWQKESDQICEAIRSIAESRNIWEKSTVFAAIWLQILQPDLKFGSRVRKKLTELGLEFRHVVWYAEWMDFNRDESTVPNAEKFERGFRAARSNLLEFSQRAPGSSSDPGAYTVLRTAVSAFLDHVYQDEKPLTQSMCDVLRGAVFRLCKFRLRLDTVALASCPVCKDEFSIVLECFVKRWPRLREIFKRSYPRSCAPFLDRDVVMYRASIYWVLFRAVRHLQTDSVGVILPLEGFKIPSNRRKECYILPDVTPTALAEGSIEVVQNTRMHELQGEIAAQKKEISDLKQKADGGPKTSSVTPAAAGSSAGGTTAAGAVPTLKPTGFGSASSTGAAATVTADQEQSVGDSASFSAVAVHKTPDSASKVLGITLPDDWWLGKWLSDQMREKFYVRWELDSRGWALAWIIQRPAQDGNTKKESRLLGPSPAPAHICTSFVFSFCPAGRFCANSHPSCSPEDMKRLQEYATSCGVTCEAVTENSTAYAKSLTESGRKFLSQFTKGWSLEDCLLFAKGPGAHVPTSVADPVADFPGARLVFSGKSKSGGVHVTQQMRSQLGTKTIAQVFRAPSQS
eukprot:g19944.t1